MSHSLSGPILDLDLNRFKVIFTLNTVGQSSLLIVYQYVKRYPDTKSIKEHLINDFHISDEEFNKLFDRSMIQVIEQTPKSGESYDISLLRRCIKVLSEFYDPSSRKKGKKESELQCKCQKLVDKRNQTFHSFSGLDNDAMKKEIETINNLIDDILSSLKVQFPAKTTELSNIKKDTDDKISEILAQPLGKYEIKIYLAHKHLREEIPDFKIRCKEYGKIKMLDFLSGCRSLHDVKLLYTEVIVRQSNKYLENNPIKCTDIIKMATEDTILLINSVAGGGKTTTFRKGISDWGEGGLLMSTHDFDFIFPMLFRNTRISSVAELIGDLLPNARVKIGTKDILHCISDPSYKILFYCDGYDERNKNSQKLFIEIRDLKEKYEHIRVIITSRPESVKYLYYHRGEKLNIDHLQILGILESKRKEFLLKYHDELIKAGLSSQSTDDLLNFFDGCSSRHKDLYSLPINLAILSWLWGQDRERAKTVKSAAGLYIAISDILMEKLVCRIVQNYPSIMENICRDLDDLNDLIDQFKENMYNESLISLRHDRMYIDQTGSNNLRSVCKAIKLPFVELKGAFLLTKLEWFTDLEDSLELPHKGMMDFYSANCIASKLSQGGRTIKEILLELYNNDHSQFELEKYQNVLLLLGGILALKDASLVANHGPEIIQLLKDTGIRNNSQWYDVFEDFNLNRAAAEQFGKLIAPSLDIEDFEIKSADVEILATLIQYVNIDSVTLDIDSTDTPAQLPDLVNVLRSKNCNLIIRKIVDNNLTFWNSIT
ncbi:unnamed protein product, partial [Meganyctiphanes norvegica]